MTDNTTFRTAQVEPTPQEVQPSVAPKPEVNTNTDVEVPFSMYKSKNKLPFTADYMDIKLTWDESDMVGDVTAIEEYLNSLVLSGDMADSQKSAKEKLKSLEKLAGIDKIESQAQRLIKLSEFVKYLKSIESRKHDIY